MRLLGRLLLLLLFAIVAAFFYQPLRSLFQVPASAPDIIQQLDLEARPSPVYFLPEDGWLTFPIINQAARLRVLTHAGAHSEAKKEAPLRYVLKYQLLDNDLRLLHEGRYTQETRIPQPLYKDGIPVARNLYSDQALAVAVGQSFNMQLDALPRTAFVRLRLQPLAAPLKNVAVRVYYEERMSERQASVAWERLSQVQKERLTQGVIYPPELLTRQERLNLLERQWQPVGPLGTSPAQGTLFSIQGAETFVDPNLVPRAPGLYAGPDRLGVLPIEEEGRYRLQFIPLVDEGLDIELAISHVTEQIEQPSRERISLDSDPTSGERAFSPGLLVVTPNQPGMLDIIPLDSPEEESALPEPRYLRVWKVQPGLAVNFQFLPGESSGTSLRLDLRAHGSGKTLSQEKRIQAEYRLLNAQGKVVDAGKLEASVVPSMIDRVADTQPVADLSDPANFYLRLPPEAVHLEVTSQQQLLANAYTRPDDLPHRTRVPMDYYAWRGDNAGQPSWFILQPPATEPSTKEASLDAPEIEESLVLHVQSRPPGRNPELLAGRYQWEALDPQLAARGARILIPRQGEENLRPRGLPGYFQSLKQGTQIVEFNAPGVARRLEPQLIYLREASAPFSLRLRIDGRTVRHELIGRRGEISLPPVSPGQHEVELDANSPGTWFINYRYPDETGYLRRIAFRLQDEALRYPVDKREDGQLVGARFYSLGEAGEPSTVRVRITPDALKEEPAQEWTHLERLYQIVPTTEEAEVGHVLDRQYGRLSQGQPILINLGADIADGPVKVEFSLQSGAPGYVVFHEILPGQHLRTRGFNEEDDQ
ncbi:hypothetical protein QC823_14220 [Halomonas vilamensis]|uniref:Uncharacterized protein n=1 Tax=Vreelandella vilamensis TaxID=531309 RepID=A0ABU1H760_9GAMM|nr:hypothetical protein [Halomonas vilamensis]MDR5900136.1 hypothetical protein [Halomonas vilamensis]